MLRNAIEQAKASEIVSERVFYSDFTFNLVNEDYPLGIFGCQSLQRSERGNINVLQYRPFACVMGPSKRGEVYKLLFSSTKSVLREYENFDLDGGFICGDTNWPLTNAANKIWPGIDRLLCWPHIKREALRRNVDKLVNKDYYEEALKDMDKIHMAQTTPQAEKIRDLVFEKWMARKEVSLKKWFEKEFANSSHNKFHYSASGVITATTNNNADESFNKMVKKDINKVPLCIFVTTTMPGLISTLALNRGNSPIFVRARGTPQREMVKKASILVQDLEKTREQARYTLLYPYKIKIIVLIYLCNICIVHF